MKAQFLITLTVLFSLTSQAGVLSCDLEKVESETKREVVNSVNLGVVANTPAQIELGGLHGVRIAAQASEMAGVGRISISVREGQKTSSFSGNQKVSFNYNSGDGKALSVKCSYSGASGGFQQYQ